MRSTIIFMFAFTALVLCQADPIPEDEEQEMVLSSNLASDQNLELSNFIKIGS